MLTRFDEFRPRSFGSLSPLAQLERLFEEFDLREAAFPTKAGVERLWSGAFPRVTFKDTGATFILSADVPGLGDKDVDLSIHEDVLTLRGERKEEAPGSRYVHRRERTPVRFSRSFALPCKVDPDTSTATLKDGVLTITLAKATEARPRSIAVKAQ